MTGPGIVGRSDDTSNVFGDARLFPRVRYQEEARGRRGLVGWEATDPAQCY